MDFGHTCTVNTKNRDYLILHNITIIRQARKKTQIIALESRHTGKSTAELAAPSHQSIIRYILSSAIMMRANQSSIMAD